MDHIRHKNTGELKASNYTSLSVKEEFRKNLIKQLQNKEAGFEGILGYDETVIPDLQTAILSRHNILLLGLRGQAKTRIARLMVNLLDEYIPYVSGSEIFDDPLNPISWYAKHEIMIHRRRYACKLAAPLRQVYRKIGYA